MFVFLTCLAGLIVEQISEKSGITRKMISHSCIDLTWNDPLILSHKGKNDVY